MTHNNQSGQLVIPWRETHVIPHKYSIGPAAKDYYGLFGRALVEVQKNLVLRRLPIRPGHTGLHSTYRQPE